MDDLHAMPLKRGQIRLAAPPPETVERGDGGIGQGLDKPAAEGRPDKPAAARDEDAHGHGQVPDRRPWASTI